MIYQKPDNKVFANKAKSGEVEQFPDLERGWGISLEQTNGIPPMEWFNALFKRNDESLQYLLQRGIVEWSAAVEYPVGAVVQHANKIYRAISQSTNKQPNQNVDTLWKEWGIDTKTLENYIVNAKKSDAIDSESSDTVATSKAVKKAYDKAVEALGKDTGVPLGSIIAFPREISNPIGFLKCDGSNFGSSAYPDLYRAMGNSNVLPNLNGEIGQIAAFATNNKPNGWIWFDDIKTEVTQAKYPELYALLIAQYGSIANVPSMDDRFIRNAGNGLNIGETQGDAIRNITGEIHLVRQGGAGKRASNGALVYGSNFNVAIKSGSGDDWGSQVNFNASLVVPTAEENRPKSIVLKFAIKAQSKLIYWIKAYGEIANSGSLDVSMLAQGLQEKADKQHTHHATDIVDFNQTVTNLFNQNLSENGWCQLPNGLIMQWGNTRAQNNETVTFPIPFNQLLNIQVTIRTYKPDGDNMETFGTYSESNTNFKLFNWVSNHNGMYWLAIGK